MASTAETRVSADEELTHLLLAFGRDLSPAARPKVIAFLHLLRDAYEVKAHFAIADDGDVTLVLTGEGEPDDPLTPLLR
jgi:hypothetical protein